MENYRIEYLDGFMSEGNGIPFDKNKSQAWKDGWNDSYEGADDDEICDGLEEIINGF